MVVLSTAMKSLKLEMDPRASDREHRREDEYLLRHRSPNGETLGRRCCPASRQGAVRSHPCGRRLEQPAVPEPVPALPEPGRQTRSGFSLPRFKPQRVWTTTFLFSTGGTRTTADGTTAGTTVSRSTPSATRTDEVLYLGKADGCTVRSR